MNTIQQLPYQQWQAEAAPPAAPAAAPAAPAVAAADPAPAAPAAAPKPEGSIVAPVAEAAPSLDNVKAFLTEKGAKAEELAALDEAGLRKKYDEAKAAPAKTEAKDIEVKLPEGITVDEKAMGEFKEIMADDKLSPTERAQKLVDMHANALKQAAQSPYDLWNRTQAEWQATVKADPEIGGDKFDAMRATISKGITEIAGSAEAAQKIFDAFAYTGAGNQPEIIRAVFRLCKPFTEGGPIDGGKPAAVDKAGKVLAALYPSANQPT